MTGRVDLNRDKSVTGPRPRCSIMPLSVALPCPCQISIPQKRRTLSFIVPGEGRYTVEGLQALPLQEKPTLGRFR